MTFTRYLWPQIYCSRIVNEFKFYYEESNIKESYKWQSYFALKIEYSWDAAGKVFVSFVLSCSIDFVIHIEIRHSALRRIGKRRKYINKLRSRAHKSQRFPYFDLVMFLKSIILNWGLRLERFFGCFHNWIMTTVCVCVCADCRVRCSIEIFWINTFLWMVTYLSAFVANQILNSFLLASVAWANRFKLNNWQKYLEFFSQSISNNRCPNNRFNTLSPQLSWHR